MKKNYKITFSILILLFVFLFIGIKTNIIQNIDQYCYDLIKNWQSEEKTEILKVITNVGGLIELFFIALITIFILFLCDRRRYGKLIAFNLGISSITYLLLKNIIQRPRPPLEERLIEETGYSFPSGHATNNMVFYGLLIYFIIKNVTNKKLRNILCITIGIIPILIGFSRIYLRVHYLSDVIAGFCLGFIDLILVISYIEKNNYSKK